MVKRKVFVIGPILPFTGGIAQSNTVLCDKLSKKNDVTVISYSMMFPKIFYPGKKQRDGKVPKHHFKNEFTFNTLNPISWIRTVNKIRKETPDWVVFIWWHTYFFPSYFFVSFLLRIFSKIKINVLCHNVLPHEKGLAMELIHNPLSKLFFKSANHITTLSKSELRVLKKLVPKCNCDYILENSFEGIYAQGISKSKARKKLSIPDKKVLLYFGSVRPYKGLEDLLYAFKKVNKNDDYYLVVAGAFWGSFEKYKLKVKELEVSSSVRLINKYVSDKDVPVLFSIADLVIMSHRSATQSAIPQLAFLYNIPMIVTSVGGNKIFVDDGKTGFIVPPKSPDMMAKAIQKFFSKKLSNKFKVNMKQKRKMFGWDVKKEERFFGGIE